MVIRLRAFATEATKVTFEVGSQSELGGSPMIEGIWQEITHNVGTWSFVWNGYLPLHRSIACAPI